MSLKRLEILNTNVQLKLLIGLVLNKGKKKNFIKFALSMVYQ